MRRCVRKKKRRGRRRPSTLSFLPFSPSQIFQDFLAWKDSSVGAQSGKKTELPSILFDKLFLWCCFKTLFALPTSTAGGRNIEGKPPRISLNMIADNFKCSGVILVFFLCYAMQKARFPLGPFFLWILLLRFPPPRPSAKTRDQRHLVWRRFSEFEAEFWKAKEAAVEGGASKRKQI